MISRARYGAIVIGGGVNGLTCATALAKKGVRTLLLEQRPELGGCAAESEIAPGFKVPTLAHATGPVRRDVIEELQLYLHGLEFSDAAITVSALSPEGRPLVIFEDGRKTAEGLRTWSATDAERFASFQATLQRLGGLIASTFMHTPPSVDAPSARDVFALMHTLSDFRSLPKDDQWRLLRWGPMAAADLVSESIDTELLRATIAADGIFGAMLGPWSAGSGLQLLLAAANRTLAWPAGRFVNGGPIAVVRSLEAAARRFGVEIRTGSQVTRIDAKDDRAVGVTLDGGEHIEARAVVSGVDPKRTFLTLCDADHLPPEFLWRMKHYRSRGTLAKINLALSALPSFTGATREMLASRVRLAPDLDYLERAFDDAKYGRFSTSPWIEFTIPSLTDATLAPPGAHVLSAYAQFAPYQLRDQGSGIGDQGSGIRGQGSGIRDQHLWDRDRDALGDCVVKTLAQYAPGLESLIVHRQTITPLDLERGWGLTGGQIFHGELSLDQFFTMRPLLGFGQHRSPLKGLFLCGSGSHPGTGLTGGSGMNAAREIARDLS
ncbi:MAG TPA: NAD(P)/FAD-dependent oxidoreductase [Vicinamibacterales bacterium]|nr:NAD(P)/FAD-dependent oxidoreductase [Vicinamibacterales bacterium]